ncbi:MAG TPA: ArsI/CadI family heavy metal resistance metalloenzyme [Candidatus Baltobacteraceae bacterium]|jgi:catechol 2,3-dioxygenase-like lactoylglutathione lyase family enzyme
MKTHISLHTADLERSVAFYMTLLDIAPAKRFDDYALFIAEEPGLELALNRAKTVASASDTHYGIATTSTDAVDAAVARLQRAGLSIDIEVEETCCYAKQNKVWTRDPDGRRWETYVVLEEADEATSCCST